MTKNLRFDQRVRFALAGIRAAFQREQSFRLQSIATVGILGILFFLRPTPVWWAIFVLVIGQVLAFELVNTALEALLDRLHPDLHDSIRLAKDCAAGAVLIASLISILVFGFFVWERFG